MLRQQRAAHRKPVPGDVVIHRGQEWTVFAVGSHYMRLLRPGMKIPQMVHLRDFSFKPPEDLPSTPKTADEEFLS